MNVVHVNHVSLMIRQSLLHCLCQLFLCSLAFQFFILMRTMESLITPDYPWDDMHHCSYLLLQDAFAPSTYSYQYTVEAKDLIPHGHVDWFQNPIPALGVFEKANMANISPTIKVDISVTPGVVENRLLGYTCSLLKVSAYKALFKEFCDIFA